MPERHAIVLRASEDSRNLFDIAINIHMDDDPAVDAILTALDRPLDHTDPVESAIQVQESHRLVGLDVRITGDAKPPSVVVTDGKARGRHGQRDDIMLEGYLPFSGLKRAGPIAKVAHQHGLAAGCVQDRKGGLALALGAPGQVAYVSWALASDSPAALHIAGETLTVAVDAEHKAQQVRVTAPGAWRLADGAPEGVRLNPAGETFTVSMPPGVQQIVLHR